MIRDGFLTVVANYRDAEVPEYRPFARFDHGAAQVRRQHVCADPTEDRADYTHWERVETPDPLVAVWRFWWEPADLEQPAVAARVEQILGDLNYSEDDGTFDCLRFRSTVKEMRASMAVAAAQYRSRATDLGLPTNALGALGAIDLSGSPLLFDQMREGYLSTLSGRFTSWVPMFRDGNGHLKIDAVITALDELVALGTDDPARAIHWLFQWGTYEKVLG